MTRHPWGIAAAWREYVNGAYLGNLAGALTSESYPSGRVLTTGYDSANRAATVAGRRNGGAQTNYVTSVSYWPHGAPNTMVYGNTLNVVEGYFNKELQVTGMWHVIAGNPNEFLWLEYPNWGTTTNNGNLQGKTEYAGGPAPWTTLPYYSQSFTYDGVNRLETATDTTGSTVNWSRTFNYDQYGNAWVPTASGVGYGVSTPEWNVYNTKNQVSSSPYDAAGNISALPPGYTFVYDAENRITAETNSGGLSANYYYDGMGDRVEKVLSNGQAIVSVYDAFGRLAEEYSPATTWSKDFVPFNGQTVAVENATANPCTTCYLSYDYLGTPRLVTDANANVKGRHDYLPFGDEIPGGVAGRSSQFGPYVDNVNQKFTGQYRDTETLNDFFNARYYTAPLMRFLSADPASLAAVDPTDPQTWNQYAYVRNSPLVLVDPSGMDPVAFGGIDDGCWFDSLDSSDDPFGWFPICDFPIPIFPPVGGVGGGGGGHGGQSAPTSNGGLAPASPPFPPGSFPGGENLGLPPGLSVPGPWGLPSSPFGIPLAPNPTTVVAETTLQAILRYAVGPVLLLELLLNPSAAGGRSEIEFENANKRRYALSVQRYAGPQASTDPECVEQWREALDICSEPGKRRPGQTLEQCAAGYVDERCGGNEVDHSRPLR